MISHAQTTVAMRLASAVAILAAGYASPSLAQEAPGGADAPRASCRAANVGAATPTTTACVLGTRRVDQAPLLDGKLDDPAWRDVPAASDFTQFEPFPGAPATERTVARVLLTPDAVYVGVRLYDAHPDSIRAQFVRRDDAGAVSDWVHVFIDSYADRRTAFQFATTPRGTRVDILRLGDTQADTTWDAVWDVATSIDQDGWTAEFRIPLSQLRFSGGSASWGINFGREIARRGELSYWAPVPPTAGRFVSLFGDLQGLEEVRAPRRLEILPYTLGRVSREPGAEANPLIGATDLHSSTGVDFKLGLTSDLTLTGTVNPDFGQVEADPSVVNLSAFETFYPERRPFFTEGTEIFRFQLVPEGYAFYSRRIGRAPQLAVQPPAGGFADAPATAPILAAAKISGKTRSGLSIGMLGALTGRLDARVAAADGTRSTQEVEPRTGYAVARLSQDFRSGRSGFGAIATFTSRALDDTALQRLRSSAAVAGVDWFHRFGRDAFEFTGWTLGSRVVGSAEAITATQRSSVHLFQRPDADHLEVDSSRTALSGTAGEAFVRRIAGRWTWSVGGGWRTSGLDVNDIGFVSYTDTWYGSAVLRYRVVRPSRLLRSWFLEGQLVQAHSFGGELLRPSGHLIGNLQFRNFWGATVNVDHWDSHYWPWELRGGPALRRSGYTNVRASLSSDSRRTWRVNLRGRVESKGDDDGFLWTVDPTLDLRPSPRASVSVGPVYTRNTQPAQYVTQTASTDGSRAYILGRLDQTTAAVSARVSYSFSPTMTLDVYLQPFLSGGTYNEFRRVVDAGARPLDDRAPLLSPSVLSVNPALGRYRVDANADGIEEYSFRKPDFSVREFRSNTVLRWEYRPGSTLYLVWAQTRDDGVLSDFAVGSDLGALFSAPPTNVVILKLSYWLDF